MQPGDLRRFNGSVAESLQLGGRFAGRRFLILEVDCNHALAHGGSVKFLIDGRVEEGWSRWWVLESSEVISEAR